MREKRKKEKKSPRVAAIPRNERISRNIVTGIKCDPHVGITLLTQKAQGEFIPKISSLREVAPIKVFEATTNRPTIIDRAGGARNQDCKPMENERLKRRGGVCSTKKSRFLAPAAFPSFHEPALVTRTSLPRPFRRSRRKLDKTSGISGYSLVPAGPRGVIFSLSGLVPFPGARLPASSSTATKLAVFYAMTGLKRGIMVLPEAEAIVAIRGLVSWLLEDYFCDSLVGP